MSINRGSRKKTNDKKKINDKKNNMIKENTINNNIYINKSLVLLDNMTLNQLEYELSKSIKFQSFATNTISLTLHQIKKALNEREIELKKKKEDKTPTEEPIIQEKRIFKLLLAGPSGVGKTETIKKCRQYLGMNEGDIYEKQYVFYDGSTHGDETQATAIMGSGAGYMGHDNKLSLVDLLLKAVQDPEKTELEDSYEALTKPEYTARLKKLKEKSKLNPYKSPRYIMLFIDEIDKASKAFIMGLNGLLESGYMKSSRGDVFELPKETIMMVFCTSNYGAEAITQLKMNDCNAGIVFVKEDMKKNGLQACTIERFGKILIYFKPTKEEFKIIITEKLEIFIEEKNKKYSKKYGNIEYSEDVKDFLINYILSMIDYDCGIRNGLRELYENLDELFDRGLATLEDNLEEKGKKETESTEESDSIEEVHRHEQDQYHDTEPLIINIHKFNINSLCEELSHNFSKVVKKILSSSNNKKLLELCKAQPNTTDVNALALHKGKNILNINIIVPVIQVNRFYNEEQSAYRFEKLENKVEELKDALKEEKEENGNKIKELKDALKEEKKEKELIKSHFKEVISIIDKQDPEEYKEIIELTESKKYLLEPSDDTDDSQENNIKCIKNTKIKKRKYLLLDNKDKRLNISPKKYKINEISSKPYKGDNFIYYNKNPCKIVNNNNKTALLQTNNEKINSLPIISKQKRKSLLSEDEEEEEEKEEIIHTKKKIELLHNNINNQSKDKKESKNDKEPLKKCPSCLKMKKATCFFNSKKKEDKNGTILEYRFPYKNGFCCACKSRLYRTDKNNK